MPRKINEKNSPKVNSPYYEMLHDPALKPAWDKLSHKRKVPEYSKQEKKVIGNNPNKAPDFERHFDRIDHPPEKRISKSRLQKDNKIFKLAKVETHEVKGRKISIYVIERIDGSKVPFKKIKNNERYILDLHNLARLTEQGVEEILVMTRLGQACKKGLVKFYTGQTGTIPVPKRFRPTSSK